MVIPNIIDPTVPIGKDDTENVEITRYGEPIVPDFEVPYHTEIMEKFNGIDLDSARKVAGNGFYYPAAGAGRGGDGEHQRICRQRDRDRLLGLKLPAGGDAAHRQCRTGSTGPI